MSVDILIAELQFVKSNSSNTAAERFLVDHTSKIYQLMDELVETDEVIKRLR